MLHEAGSTSDNGQYLQKRCLTAKGVANDFDTIIKALAKTS